MIDVEKLKDLFKDYPYIASAHLFGSQASGKIGPMSDVDIAVLLKKPYPEGRYLIHQLDYLSFKIEELLKKEVDVVEMNRQGLIFQYNIIRTGKLIYDADPSFRANYVSRLDLLPIVILNRLSDLLKDSISRALNIDWGKYETGRHSDKDRCYCGKP